MKRYFLITVLSLWFLLPVQVDANVEVEVGVFYDTLAPYGDWIYLDSYGVWVWRPVGLWADWQPYTYGRWEWSEEYGWIWVSYFEWGWAPFHYGRWFYHEYYGWVWVPGTIWRPHWVVWIHSGPYVGWYPLYPSFIYIDYYSPVVYERWIIVETSGITSGRYKHNAISQEKRAEIFNSTSGVHRYIPKEDDSSYHTYGPPKLEIEKYSRHKIEPIKTEFTNNPINLYSFTEKRLQVYRPEFKTHISDLGKLKDTKGSFNSQGGPNNISSHTTSVLSPKHIHPLGGSFDEAKENIMYNNFSKHFSSSNTNVPSRINQPPKGIYDSKVNDGSGFGKNKVFKDEAVRAYSPQGHKEGVFPSNLSNSGSEDDGSNFRRSAPKLNPKSTIVPKSYPNLKGK